MKPLILVKHSLPEIVENIPAREWRLSEEGRTRARNLAEKLTGYQPDVIVSSMEPKAQDTAQILAEYFGLETQAYPDMHEHDRSKSPYYSKDVFQTLVQKFFANPDNLVFGTETANQALERFDKAVSFILNLYNDKTILVVAHGSVISLFVVHLTGCDGYAIWNELGLPSFVVLDMQSKKLIKTVNID